MLQIQMKDFSQSIRLSTGKPFSTNWAMEGARGPDLSSVVTVSWRRTTCTGPLNKLRVLSSRSKVVAREKASQGHQQFLNITTNSKIAFLATVVKEKVSK